ncbi:30S ribosomal protein S5 [Candidatus Micrarchaeota archaeon]|nr:30S ribosomal protein S5 [Candidatus Micrarchaeota archaeon]
MAEKVRTVDKESWEPRSKVGRKVKEGEITTFEEIVEMGKPVFEPEIIDVLLPNLEAETLKINTTQRVTDSGKRIKFRVVTVIGDRKGHVGLGVGKSDELKPALDYAVKDAKKNMTSIRMGCGSWECKCDFKHSLTSKTQGKEGSTTVTLKPAPRGLGLAGNDVVKKVLGISGVRDIWSSCHGGKNVYNMAAATINALDNINLRKPRPE